MMTVSSTGSAITVSTMAAPACRRRRRDPWRLLRRFTARLPEDFSPGETRSGRALESLPGANEFMTRVAGQVLTRRLRRFDDAQLLPDGNAARRQFSGCKLERAPRSAGRKRDAHRPQAAHDLENSV